MPKTRVYTVTAQTRNSNIILYRLDVEATSAAQACSIIKRTSTIKDVIILTAKLKKTY